VKTRIEKIHATFERNGYECYLVGGAVRDIYMGKIPKDYDLTTNATPDQIEDIFEKTYPTGKQYGTITVQIDKALFEITTYRKDMDYDGRRPKAVSFSDNLIDDLSRRDFTMNAMAMDKDGVIVDPFNGKQDIFNNKIDFVGNSDDRIKEDKLRILRAMRFSATYGFSLPKLTSQYNIETLSKERIREEFNKMLLGKYFDKLLLNDYYKYYIYQIIPELKICEGFEQNNPHHYADILGHTLDTVMLIEPKLELKLSALFHDIGKPHCYSESDRIGHFYNHNSYSEEITESIMKRLKYSNKEIDYVKKLVKNHMLELPIKNKTIKRLINKDIDLDGLFKLMLSDKLSCNSKEGIWDIYDAIEKYHKIIFTKEPFSLKDLAINGYDLIELGYKEKEIGSKLNELLDFILEYPTHNQKDILIGICKKSIKQ